jgi:hypothetical protein
MEAVAILVVIVVALRLFLCWSSSRSRDIADYYEDFEDPTAETLLRTHEMRGNGLP